MCQQPETAKGVIFVTLEDQTGSAHIKRARMTTPRRNREAAHNFCAASLQPLDFTPRCAAYRPLRRCAGAFGSAPRSACACASAASSAASVMPLRAQKLALLSGLDS